MSIDSERAEPMVVIYDGQCPFCTSYVRYARLRDAAGAVQLIDARSPHPEVENVKRLGFDLDEGMVVRIGADIYHGADAMRVLTAMSTPSHSFNRLMRFLFVSRRRAGLVYPILRSGRNLTLRMLGRTKIGQGS